jgi:hypothetical protein
MKGGYFNLGSGFLGHVLWCCGIRIREEFTFIQILWQRICYLTCELIHNFRGKCLPIPGKRLAIPGKCLPIPGKRLLIWRKCQISSKITRQCTTQKRMLLQIVCLHYSVITVTVNFSWPVKQDISNSTSSFKGRALIYLRATFYLKCPPRTCIITLSLLNLFATFIPVEAVTSGKLWSPEIGWKRN